MKTKFLILLITSLVCLPLLAAYPDLSVQGPPLLSLPGLEEQNLEDFLSVWSPYQGPSLQSLAPTLQTLVQETSLDAKQLATVVAIQQAQLDFALENRKPKIGISATPYSYTDSTTPTGPGLTQRTQKHTFSVGSSLTQNLSTGGSVNLSVKQSSAYEGFTTSAWTHTPSVSLSVSQPLWVGETMLDTGYQAKQLEKQQLALQTTQGSYKALSSAMVLQNLKLLALRQNLMENRYLIAERANLAYEQVQRAEEDLKQGLISAQAYESRLLSYYQSVSVYQNLNHEIAELEKTLSLTWADALPKDLTLSQFNLESMIDQVTKTDVMLTRYLLEDADYQKAVKELRSATLDSGFYALSDAPQIQLSFQLSPFYSPAANTSFFESFSSMFSDSKPLLSFSIGFSATDLFRRSSDLQQNSAEQALLSAKAKVEQAYKNAEAEVRAIQQDMLTYRMNLILQLKEYEHKQVALEAEQIRFSAGISDPSAVRQKELDVMQAAFTALGTLRELEYLFLRLSLSGMLS
ncbi:MAG: TolC family protein [Sphaerochaeta associata]|uniref:TolC family protein n=1 Tax=Sphaerochaeta associata TaxID=1129264 RepID=UPI002B1FCA5A|nr:TolC family protein [Sphaerochaeta associata]MEA5029210.1 TolC family protein [Sphaerochaeta associata]